MKLRTNFILKTKINKSIAIKLANNIKDSEKLKFAITLISCIEDKQKLNLFIKAACCKELINSNYYKQTLTLIFMENDIDIINYMVNTLCNSSIIYSPCFKNILNFIDSSKKDTTYILAIAEGLLINNKDGILPNVYRKIMNLDKHLVIRLITVINKYKNKEKVINIVSKIILKSIDINITESNLNLLISKLEEILLIDDSDGINILLNLIHKQVDKSKEKIVLSLPNTLQYIDKGFAKQFKFVG